jgi:hypothetical protein
MAPPTIHLSFDQDWAPAWSTLALRDALASHGVYGTLFGTHDCTSFDALREAGWELGWHPNFMPGSSHGSSMDEVLDTLHGWLPDARGVRAHCLVRGTPYLQAYRSRSLVYDASDLHDGEADLKPFRSWTGLVRLPIFFEDDVHLERGHPCSMDALNLRRPGLKVLVALNAADLRGYAALKSDLASRGRSLTEATPEDMARHGQAERPGVGDLMHALLAAHGRSELRIGGSLAEVAQAAL